MGDLTVRQIESLRKQARVKHKAVAKSDSKGRGAGVLRLRAYPSGDVALYYRYTRSDGGRDDYPLGPYSKDGHDGLTLESARARVEELKLVYRSGVKDVRLYLEAKAREEAEERRRSVEEQTREQAGTLKALLETYILYLRTSAKASARDVETTLTRHVLEAFPELAKQRANSIKTKDLKPIFDRIANQGHTRTLGKLRSLLHSAYNLASRAQYNSTLPEAFQSFVVSTNPVTPLPTYSEQSVPRHTVLKRAELRALLRALTETPSMTSRALRVAIYLGGQRPTQLLRLNADGVDFERATITLLDGKGRRTHPRLHVLPLEPVESLIRECVSINANAPSLFSPDGKRSPDPSTISRLVRSISDGAYRLADVRRTCETELARMGVSTDLRAQILSHGITGVQAKHYDRYGYLAEKHGVLMRWGQFLDAVRSDC